METNRTMEIDFEELSYEFLEEIEEITTPACGQLRAVSKKLNYIMKERG